MDPLNPLLGSLSFVLTQFHVGFLAAVRHIPRYHIPVLLLTYHLVSFAGSPLIMNHLQKCHRVQSLDLFTHFSGAVISFMVLSAIYLVTAPNFIF